MKRNNESKTAREIVSNLFDVTAPTFDDVMKMTDEEIRCELQERDVDVDESVNSILKTVVQCQNKLRLSLARQKKERLDHLQKTIKDAYKRASGNTDEFIKGIQEKLKLDTKQLAVFCRKFEESSMEDKCSLIEDYEFLNKMIEEENE